MTAASLRWADVIRLLVTWLLAFLALLMTALLLPGFTHTSWLPLVAAAAMTGLVGMIVRPVLVQLAAAFAALLAFTFVVPWWLRRRGRGE